MFNNRKETSQLQTLFKSTIFIVIILVTPLFYGCNRHALQDLLDGKTISKSSSEESIQLKKDPEPIPPSQNKALNSISPSSSSNDEHKEDRYLQKSTNEWLQNDWVPLTEGNTSKPQETNSTTNDTNVSVKTSDYNRTADDINSTGLQYYVDKAGIYIENRDKRDANKTKPPSHTKKINAMPGIGKTKGRR